MWHKLKARAFVRGLPLRMMKSNVVPWVNDSKRFLVIRIKYVVEKDTCVNASTSNKSRIVEVDADEFSLN